MRLNEITENKSYENVQLKSLLPYKDFLLNYLDTNYPTKIYRGMNNTNGIIFGDGNLLNRKSSNTANYYTLLFDYLPSWKKFPKRSKSFICSTSLQYAEGYGEAQFIVIPLENQKIGVCPADDIWISIRLQSPLDASSLPEFNDVLDNSFRLYKKFIDSSNSNLVKKYENPKISLETAEGIIELMHTCSSLAQISSENLIYKILGPAGVPTEKILSIKNNFAWLFSRYKEIISLPKINEMLSPYEHNFKLVNFEQLSNSDLEDNEVWLSGKVLFLERKNWQRYISMIEDLED